MIDSIDIKRFRGIREGTVGPLAPLTILVGPNGCGKSAVLEALFIGTNRYPADAVGKVVARWKGQMEGAARWTFFRSAKEGGALIEVRGTLDASKRTRVTALELRPALPSPTVTTIEVRVSNSPHGGWSPRGDVQVAADNTSSASLTPVDHEPLRLTPDVKLLKADRATHSLTLDEAYSELAEHGFKEAVNELIKTLLPAARGLQILTHDKKPYLAVDFPSGAVPVAVTGDGTRSIIRHAMELAMDPSGLALLDEPDAFMHPAAIRLLARAVWASVSRKVQVVIATHSLELIDALVAETPADANEELAVFRLALSDSLLRTTRMNGDTVVRRRSEIDEDLR